ncbi:MULTISPECIES: DUF1778 domain-containing protein [Acidithiobacillus]|nr:MULTISPECIES: DUF1778 domain-containing protein [Acidithiobacillus]MEB8487948.1 DUF1778 domain-containing protein [Acidithiobacillus ferriphilus]MEB8490872.1 DUF1778 domain-containing protein [Acidithiobacillus ferriphilus]MEB8491823.1 DUF1778 domain-containing protein [Acidithiobacillus ferriphilus]MEB8513979.1 DUF1778 domain-containing protein [Acidithiobacillus ferriphilus]MEB8521811.1 DUF1778 domain-containing protein [Acidithiobacillus ferriphilus]
MSYRVVFSPEAQEQLAELYRYIAEAASPDIAAQYTEAQALPTTLRRPPQRAEIGLSRGVVMYGNLPHNRGQEGKPMPQPFSTARLEARISTDMHSMLKRAAELQGRTMTDFVVADVQDAAQRAIEQAEIIFRSFL